MFDKALKLILLLSPIAYAKGMPLNEYDSIIFRLSVLVLFVAALWSKPQRYIDFRPLSTILILCGFNFAINQFNIYILLNLIPLFFGITVVLLVSIYCEKPRDCFKFIMWAGMVNIAVFAAQKVGFAPIVTNPLGEPGGILGNGPVLCMYLALTLPLVFKINVWVSLIYMIIGIMCGEMLVILFGIGLWVNKYLTKDKRTIIILISSGLVGAGLFLTGHISQSVNIRWIAWKPIIEQIFSRPFLGFGLGMLPHLAGQFMNLIAGDQHYYVNHCLSSYISFIFGVGLLGVAWLGYIFRHFIKTFKTNTESLAIVALLILCAVEYPFEVPKLWLTISAIIGFYLIKEDGDASKINRES